MTFSSPMLLLALFALPLFALLEWAAAGRAKRAVMLLVGGRPDHPLLSQRIPGQRRIGALLRGGAFTLLVLGAAGPEWGRESVRRQSRGSDVVFVIDVSASMDARDVPPSRLDEARREALGLLDRLEGSRVGVIAFAGDAVRFCPLTLDRAAARLTLESLTSGCVSEPGSDLGRALRTAAHLLPNARREEQAVVLWTDGEDLEGHAAEALDAVQQAGIRVFAVGVGTVAGEVIPVLDDLGRAIDVKKDENGQLVRSRLDEALLRRIGRATRGGYFSASRPGGELPRLAAALGTLARGGRGMRLVERPVSRFPAFAGAAALLLACELARPRRRVAATPARARRARAAAAARVAALALLASFVARPAESQTAWARGDAAFRQGRWAAAESLYVLRARRGAPEPVKINLATARAKLGKRDDALRDLGHLSATDNTPGRAAGYNLGTLLGEQKDYDRALGELRRALERDPADEDARWNYELVRRERDGARNRQNPSPSPAPSPQQPQPGRPGGQGAPQPNAGRNPGALPQMPGQAPPQPLDAPPTPGGTGMTRQQAEQLLGSLQELERLEQQRLRRGRVTREKKGKDW